MGNIHLDPYNYNSVLELFSNPNFLKDPAVLTFLGVVCGLVLFALISYILLSVGLHRLARDRKIRHGWLAWLPLGREWILGSIADQYQHVVKGRVKSRRKTLLGFGITVLILSLVQLACVICTNAYTFNWFIIDYYLAMQLSVAAELLSVAVSVVSLIWFIWEYIVLFDLYASCEPDGAPAFLVVSLVIPVTLPFFVFACRKLEYGMPPRKPAMPISNTWTPPETAE